MAIASARKQNSSCDPCRRSKRRCSFPEGVPGPPHSCVNCLHLGHTCTFNFVNARLSQKRNKARPTAPCALQQPIAPATPRDPRQIALPMRPDPNSVEALPNTIQNALWTGVSYPGLLDVGMFMGNMVSEWTNLDRRIFDTDDAATGSYQGSTTPSSTSQDPSGYYQPQRAQDLQPQHSSTLGLWPGSPIHLLNSSVEKKRINQSLGDVYNSMMSGIAIRYLDYNCNLFAGPYKYSFESDTPRSSSVNTASRQSVTAGFTAPWRKTSTGDVGNSQLQPITAESLASQINKVTMIGVARFLDNFGPLYGNCVDQKTRNQNERTLTAVLQAFALQYLPSRHADGPLAQFYENLDRNGPSQESPTDRSTNSSHVFTSAWFNAHSHLVASRGSRSFVKLYSVFLFQMTSVPEEAASIHPREETPLGLLDDGLRQLEELQGLVDDYCEHLGRYSIYRVLLQSSVGIMRWYAYLRDTIDSVLHERPCMLKDAPLRSQGGKDEKPLLCMYSLLIASTGSLLSGHAAPQWQEPARFDEEVPEHCKNAAGDLFRVFRGIIHLRQLLLPGSSPFDVQAVRNMVALALSVFDEFAITYGPWLEQCVISFYILSEKSKLASGKLIEVLQMAHPS